MNSSVAYEKSETALLGRKESFLKYNTLSSSSAENIAGLTKSGVRRKVREAQDDFDIELNYIGTSQSGNIQKSNTVLLCEDILPNDTLQSFALRYGCTVNDLKRANNLITEQDFYALKKLKIPVSRYSLLTVPEEKKRHREIYDQFQSEASSAKSSSTLLSATLDPQMRTSFETILPSQPATTTSKMETPSSSELGSSESLEETAALLQPSSSLKLADPTDRNDTSLYLKKLDKDIRKTVKKADFKNGHSQHNESLNEVLSSIQYFPMEPMSPPRGRGQRTNGADCGMKWWALILCFFIIFVIIIALAIFEYYRSKK